MHAPEAKAVPDLAAPTIAELEPKARPAPIAWAARALRLAARTTLDLVYPPSCLVCRAATSDLGTLCPACWAKMRFIERPYCERLGIPFAQDLGAGLLSPEAIADPPVYQRARAVVRFDDGPARALVHLLKYGDRTEMAKPIGRWMARAGIELLETANLIVPIPLHRHRLATRRFNQAAALAQSISSVCGVPTDFLALERVKPTPPQVGLSKLQRAGNVQGAFRVADAARLRISGRRIVLVDDVLTSGATTNAAARALLRGGAAQVDVLVFARVVTGP
jgi:ComF family protein